jgi:hypothetical protein
VTIVLIAFFLIFQAAMVNPSTWLNRLVYRPIQYAYSASNESSAAGGNQNESAGPLTCSGSTYLKLFPTKHCASFSECKKVDSGPFQGTYECPGESTLIVPPELLCPDRTFKGINGTCGGSSSPSEEQPQENQKCAKLDVSPVFLRPTSKDNILMASFSSGRKNHHQNYFFNVLEQQQPATTTQSATALTYENDPWKLTYQIVNNEGLVLRDITAGGKLQFKSISIPHFKVDYGLSHEYVRYNSKTDCANPVVLKRDFPKKYIDTIQWQFTKELNQEGIKGNLTISYDIVIRTKYVNNCEKGAGFNCYRFIPKVSFSWSGEPSELKHLTAYYRFDYGKVGYALTSDYNWFPLFLVNNLHRQDILTTETKFTAVNNGKEGKFDNIHTVHENEQVIIPGCARSAPFHVIGGALKWGTYNAFDCQHMHWRWSSSVAPLKVDPMVEPSDETPIPSGRGEPNLVPGQAIQVGIVKVDESSENDPDEPLWLIDLKNPKVIATTYTKNDYDRPILPFERPEKTLKSIVGSTILWYVATTKESTHQDTFFRNGIFVIDPPKTKKAELERVRSSLEGVAIDPQNKDVILSQLDLALRSDNWSPDGMSISEKNGEAFFTGLQSAIISLFEANAAKPELAGDVNEVLAAILTSVQDIVDTDVQTRMLNTLAAYPGDKSTVAKLFTESGSLRQSVEEFNAASNITDPNKSKEILVGLKETWNNGIQAVKQVSANLTGKNISLSSATGNASERVPNLSGIWSADDGGTYYISKVGNTVWWFGLANDGESFSNVLKGSIYNREIGGEWSDVPKGTTRNHGTLNLNITYNSINGLQLHKINQTGGFAGSTWTQLEGEHMGSQDNSSLLPVQTSNKENKSSTEDLGRMSLNQDQKTTSDVIASPDSAVQGFKIADETINIEAGSYQFYNFEINPQIPEAKLTGAYRETSGNDVAVSLYETSSCNSGSSEQLDLTTCNVIHSETKSSGKIQLQLTPGKYYLVFATVEDSSDIKVKLQFEASKD